MRGKIPHMILKIDLEKAFDKIEWSFIRDTLHAFNFPTDIINLIMSVSIDDTVQNKERCLISISRGHYKLNTDGIAVGNPGKGSVGGVFRNSSGNWVLGFLGSLPDTTNTQAELLAVLKGLQIADQRGFIPLEINTDSTERLEYIKDEEDKEQLLVWCMEHVRHF
ncbi:uncharacterized protein [Nicotiana sylvestris]|uniref:uncharacterized protein n=1 Tax=Nicotiana sylvestris TaxID=4096 RepID=UPI00388C4F2A